jgi:hypothetical protein
MHVLELLDNWRKEQEAKRENSEDNKALLRAKEIYNHQKNSVEKIRDTDGYKEIVAYFTRIKEAADVTMTSYGLTLEEKQEAIAAYKITKEFLLFLNNIGSK